MAANKKVRFGPTAMPTAATNIVNPGTATAGTGISPAPATQYVLITHIRIVNKSASAQTFTFFIGATGGSAAGTEVLGGLQSIPANSSVDFYPAGGLRLDNADFLTATCSTVTTLVFLGEGEVGIA